MRGRTAAVPTVSIGQPNAQGDLDKAIIRRYIKRNIQKIQYCYEKQLLAKPGLAGTVSTQFFITPNGTVASSTGSRRRPRGRELRRRRHQGHRVPEAEGRRRRAGELPVHVPPGRLVSPSVSSSGWRRRRTRDRRCRFRRSDRSDLRHAMNRSTFRPMKLARCRRSASACRRRSPVVRTRRATTRSRPRTRATRRSARSSTTPRSPTYKKAIETVARQPPRLVRPRRRVRAAAASGRTRPTRSRPRCSSRPSRRCTRCGTASRSTRRRSRARAKIRRASENKKPEEVQPDLDARQLREAAAAPAGGGQAQRRPVARALLPRPDLPRAPDKPKEAADEFTKALEREPARAGPVRRARRALPPVGLHRSGDQGRRRQGTVERAGHERGQRHLVRARHGLRRQAPGRQGDRRVHQGDRVEARTTTRRSSSAVRRTSARATSPTRSATSRSSRRPAARRSSSPSSRRRRC